MESQLDTSWNFCINQHPARPTCSVEASLCTSSNVLKDHLVGTPALNVTTTSPASLPANATLTCYPFRTPHTSVKPVWRMMMYECQNATVTKSLCGTNEDIIPKSCPKCSFVLGPMNISAAQTLGYIRIICYQNHCEIQAPHATPKSSHISIPFYLVMGSIFTSPSSSGQLRCPRATSFRASTRS